MKSKRELIPGSKIQYKHMDGVIYTGWVVFNDNDGTSLCRFRNFHGHNGSCGSGVIGKVLTKDFWFVMNDEVKVLSYNDAMPGDFVRINGNNRKIVSRGTGDAVYIEWPERTNYTGGCAKDKIDPAVLRKGVNYIDLEDVDAFFKSDEAFYGKKTTETKKENELEINNKTKFHVGDKVNFKKNGTTYVGKIVMIENESILCKFEAPFVGHTASLSWGYIGKQTEDRFWWCDENQLKLISNTNQKIEITTDGKKTTAVLFDENGKIVRKASTKCSDSDTFNFEIGAQIAMKRLKLEEVPAEDLVEKPKYSLVKCVGYTQTTEFYFTVGKTYKIYDDGKITNENKFTYDENFATSKEEMLKYLSKWYIFEEVE